MGARLPPDSKESRGLFCFWANVRYDAKCSRCGPVEVVKAMTDLWPCKHAGCGGQLIRLFTAPAVIFTVPGFYATDVQRLKSQIGSAKYSRFEAAKQDAERRAKAGRLTPYERALERI